MKNNWKSKKYRDECNQFFIEGKKLFLELICLKNIKVIKVYLSEKLKNDAEIISAIKLNDLDGITEIVKDYVYASLSDEKSPEGIMCILEKPISRTFNFTCPAFLFDTVQDPGNIGTIIRTANALGQFNLILNSDCADIYNPKVIRASAGAVFHQAIYVSGNIENEIKKLKSHGYKIYSTYLPDKTVSIKNMQFQQKSAILFGSEGQGLSLSLNKYCDANITIPLNGTAESLNVAVAAAIFMWGFI